MRTSRYGPGVRRPSPEELERFADLTYEDFRALAVDPELSEHQRIGFPNAYREGYEHPILADIRSKLPRLAGPAGTVLEVGPGCGPLPRLFADVCRAAGHEVCWVDSEEMLQQLPDGPGLRKVAGRFPEAADDLALDGQVDVVLTYSVLHYAFAGDGGLRFFDRILELLAPGGQALIGDIPNVSMRRRFFASDAGKAFHRSFTGRDEDPTVTFNVPERGAIDDAALIGLVLRARAAGFDAYLLPQSADLPMANRREDLLVSRP